MELARMSVKNIILSFSLIFSLSVSADSAQASNSVELSSTEKENLKLPIKLQDLAYGNILFEYYRGNSLEALNAILVAEKKKLLPHHSQNARLLSGVIYLDLGMLEHAQSIFSHLLTEQDLKSDFLAKLEFYLGKIHYRQNDFAQAETRLNKVINVIAPDLRDESYLMLSNIALKQGHKDNALTLLGHISKDSKLAAYSRFNLGIILLREGDFVKATPLLAAPYGEYTTDKIMKSLQDKGLVALGYYYLGQKNFAKAREYFLKVRLHSPSSNKALLGMGWSYLEADSPRKALSHWLALKDRDIRDLAVQEALLAIPYAYQKLDSMQPALQSYLHASDVFQQQIDQIDALVQQIEQGDLVEKFVDKLVNSQSQTMDDDGVQDARLFGDQYDYYLFELVSQNQFNENFRNYQKLGRLARIVSHWEEQLPVSDQILAANQIRSDEQIPLADQYLAEKPFEEQKQRLATIQTDIADLKQDKRFYLLANDQQLEIYQRIHRDEEIIGKLPADMINDEQREKLRRAEGVMQWQLESGKVGKIWELQKVANQVAEMLTQISQRRVALQSARDAATVRFIGYQDKIDQGKQGLLGLSDKITEQIQLQSDEIKQQIIKVLMQRRASLDHYLLQSDLSIARLNQQAIDIPEVN